MRRAYWSVLVLSLVCGVLASGCAGAAPATPAPAPLPSPSLETSQAPGTVSASVVVEPALQSEMAFLVGAPVKQVYVKAGDHVDAGQPLIVLDTPDLEYAVVAAEADLKSAQA